DYVIGYLVFRSIGAPTGLTQLTPSAIPGTSFSDVHLSATTQYNYAIRAVNSWGVASDLTTTKSGVPNSTTDVVPPGAPTGLAAVADCTTGLPQINLSWNAN